MIGNNKTQKKIKHKKGQKLHFEHNFKKWKLIDS